MTHSGNLFQWMRVKSLVKALGMEKSFGCKLSPYADELLKRLTELVDEQLLKQKELIK